MLKCLNLLSWQTWPHLFALILQTGNIPDHPMVVLYLSIEDKILLLSDVGGELVGGSQMMDIDLFLGHSGLNLSYQFNAFLLNFFIFAPVYHIFLIITEGRV